MAITSSYPIATPTANDTLVGTKFIENKEPTTNSFNIGDLADFIAGYVTVSPISIGVANGLNLTGNTLSLGLASSSANGALSSTDWSTFNNKQVALSGTGIVKSSGGTISYLTDNSVNWNTAYNDSIISAAVTGTGVKTLTLTQQDGGTLSTFWVDGGGGGGIAVGTPANGLSITDDFLYLALASSSTIGALSSTDWVTFNSKQAPLTFSAPLLNTSNTISLPAATSSVNGYLSSADWSTFNSKQNAISGSGLVKSTSGTISYVADGSANWNTAYDGTIVSANVTGTSTLVLSLNQQDGGVITASWASGGGTSGVSSFNTRTGAVTLTSSDVTTALGFAPYNSSNPAGYITGITSSQVTTALGYTPYNSTNPAGYTTNTGTVTSVGGAGSVSGLTLSGSVTTSGNLTLGGSLSLTSLQITNGLGFTPYNSSNPAGYTTNTGTVTSVGGTGSVSGLTLSGSVTGAGNLTLSGTLSLTSGQVTGALGYTPYNSTNPAGYITSAPLANYLPLSGGTVSGSITASGGFFNSDMRLKDIISRDGDVVVFKWKDGRDDKTHIGYIAQEVQEILPDTIKEGEDGILSVNYIEVLVAKILKMEKEIELLKSK